MREPFNRLGPSQGNTMTGLNKVVRLFMMLMFVFFLFTFYFQYILKNKNPGDQPPDAAVKQFARCYGKPCMDDIGALVTPGFRDFKPVSVWVADTWRALKESKYLRLSGRVLDSRVKENRAVVSMASTIKTVDGQIDQTEIYYLVMKNGRWLIAERALSPGKVDLGALNF